MKCPKCNSWCRLKMTGAVCSNSTCGWYTHDRSLPIPVFNPQKNKPGQTDGPLLDIGIDI